jgi:transposase, IS30 family
LLYWLMNYYKHIVRVERIEIAILLSKGYSTADIAKQLGRSPSSIYRELKRNTVAGSYNSLKADHKAYVNRKYSKYQAMRIIEDMKLREYVDKHLRLKWSPEQIAGRLAHEAGLEPISAPTIYKYIRSPYGRVLEHELELARIKRNKTKAQRKVTALKDRIFIDKRPEAANVRAQYGHWEGDFIVAGRNHPNASLLVLHERVSRYTYVRKISARTSKQVEDTLCTAIAKLGPFKSLTLDNDIAFRRHTKLSNLIGAPIYFTHPYHSWEKGGVENANRLIRRFAPKGCDISKITHKQVANIEHWINTLPRKILDYHTAEEIRAEQIEEAKLC